MPERNVAKRCISHKVKDAHPAKPNYGEINAAAVEMLPLLLTHWLPNGRFSGREYIALNPKRDDKRLGSFRINMRTGRWADFATQDKGGDVISLYAFLNSLRQSDAAYRLHNEVKGGR
jgi:putative DNA primase/helicase